MELHEISQRAVRSIIALISRTFVLNIINFLGALILTMFLTVGEFGIYVITSAIIEILTYFSDIGLAGALIQKKGKLKEEEINATFTVQLGLISTGIFIAFLFTSSIQKFYGLSQDAVYLFYALLLSFFLSSLKTIPSILCERELEFKKVVIPQIAETIVFNAIIIPLAYMGFGVQSYIFGVIARAFVGTFVIYYLVPWRPKLEFSFSPIKGLLKFGIPYQMNSLLAVFKDKISLLILGKIIGVEGMGILGWAEKWANLPLRYILDATVKIAFPLFSRLQDNLDKASKQLEIAIYFISIMIFPMLAGGYIAMPILLETIPKYQKWEVGLMTFNYFLISAAVAGISTFLTNFLTGIGRVKAVLGLMLMWTVLTLTLYPFLATKYGFEGVALGSVIISFTSIIPLILVKRVVEFNLLTNILPPLLASVGMYGGVTIGLNYISQNNFKLLFAVIAGNLMYWSLLILIDKERLVGYIRRALQHAR